MWIKDEIFNLLNTISCFLFDEFRIYYTKISLFENIFFVKQWQELVRRGLWFNVFWFSDSFIFIYLLMFVIWLCCWIWDFEGFIGILPMASKRQNKVLVLSFSIHNIVMLAVFEILIFFFFLCLGSFCLGLGLVENELYSGY